MSFLFISYSFLFEGLTRYLIGFLVPVFGCFMVSSFLAFGATGEFKITYLRSGPTEIRIWFIILNCVIIKFGTYYIDKFFVLIFIFFFVALFIVIFRTQRYIWNIDMEDKRNRDVETSQEPAV